MSMTYDQTPPEVDFSDDVTTPRSRRLRWGAAALVVVLAAGAGIGFVFTGGSSPPATHSTTPPSPYALNHDPAPSLAGAYSDNLIVAFRALYAYGNWADEHPAPGLVANYSDPAGPIFSVESHNLDYLVSHSAHYPTDPRGYQGDLQFVRVSQTPSPVLASDGRQEMRNGKPAFGPGVVAVVVRYLRSDIYSNSGHFLQPGQKAGLYALSYSLRQSATGQWKLYSVLQLHPPGGPQTLEDSP